MQRNVVDATGTSTGRAAWAARARSARRARRRLAPRAHQEQVQVQGREDNWRSGTCKFAAGHFTSNKEKLRKKLRLPAKQKKKKAVRCV